MAPFPVRPPYTPPNLGWLERDGPPLADDFLWGVATAGFQVEGGYNGPGGPENNWGWWERRGRATPAGEADRFWDDWERYLDLAAGIGLNAFRLSVEWTRLQPQRAGQMDPAALARYANILAGCRARGLEPVVTLYHFTHPAWLGTDPWVDGPGPDAFSRFAGEAATAIGRALADRGVAPVTWWITLNEPNIFSLVTYGLGAFPHRRRPGPAAFRRCLDQMMAAHVLSYRAVHRAHEAEGWLRPVVAFNSYAMTAYGLDRAVVDVAVARELGLGPDRLRGFLTTQRERFEMEIEGLRGPAATMADGALERLLLPDLVEAFPGYRMALSRGEGTAHDVVAIDYYVAPVADHVRRPFAGRWRGRRNPVVAELWETTIRPEGLRQLLRANYRWDRPVPVLVAENGMSNRVVGGRSYRRTDGWTRPAFLRAHLGELLQAAHDGVQVAGYLHWTLADNYEWGSYEPRFGLYGVDRREGVRVLSRDAMGQDAAGTYRSIVSALRSGDGPAALAELSTGRDPDPAEPG